jgi:hypothetical protein
MLLRGRKIDSMRFDCVPNYVDTSVYLELHNLETANYNIAMLCESVCSLCRCLLKDPAWNPDPRNGRSQDQEYIYHFLCTYRVTYEDDVLPHTDSLSEKAVKKVESVIQGLSELYLYNGSSSTPQLSHELTVEEYNDGVKFFAFMVEGGRSFGKTANGRIFNAMHGPQAGDAIMALEGSETLWTLRPVGNDEYRLIGDIYVDGCMQGELYDGVDPDEVDYEIRIV